MTLETMPLSKALNAGMRKAMENDPKVLLMGEDIGKLGGVFRVTEHLQRDFGDRRVLDTPLAESGIVGTAIGMAMVGYRPVIEIQFDGFVFPAFDQITTQLAKLTNRHEGALSNADRDPHPPTAGHIGAVEHQPGEPEEAYFAHTPGLRRGVAVDAQRRLLDDPGSDRVERPRDLHGAEEPLLAEGRGTTSTPPPCRCTRRASSARAAT